MTEPGSANDLLYALQGLALHRNLPIPADLGSLHGLLSFLDELREDKALVLLTFPPWSPGGDKAPYAVTIGSGLLSGGSGIKVEDESLPVAVAQAVLDYARRCWGFDW
jgi:hypothetical protein